ncbi:MAG: DUF2461 domain-containing protein [Bacteroidetes bacterium]|nr:DUF2461 domain-containing protein [Bacteroidota bacterium]
MLNKTTISFLKSLSRNNNRDWFEAHRAQYLEAKTDFENFVTALIETLSKTEPRYKNLEAKKCIFRIYRDVRFSKDKSPYKTHLAAYFNPAAKQQEQAGLYIHISPGGSFIGGGRFMPDAAALRKIRQEIDYNTDQFKKILSDKNFKKQFKELENYKLKKAPRDYPKDHPHIELLKYTGFIVSKPLTDDAVTGKQLLKEINTAFVAMKPLLDFLNRAVD